MKKLSLIIITMLITLFTLFTINVFATDLSISTPVSYYAGEYDNNALGITAKLGYTHKIVIYNIEYNHKEFTLNSNHMSINNLGFNFGGHFTVYRFYTDITLGYKFVNLVNAPYENNRAININNITGFKIKDNEGLIYIECGYDQMIDTPENYDIDELDLSNGYISAGIKIYF